ncbi:MULTISPECIES: hypothetical protein [unclassified Pseudoclavibacter]|uniref:hypothetical protein n=1 Tax=unclassified Pseudoclavibacter TaxID=2615177 RepID=UPI001BAB34E9|nr:hypothetical protein [Pseudoclavibacter sp. Marseille-Q4354]MBS3177739.1 hypothetical protein [Pseudoclavibacter sp. Marseille-Q4354]
MSRATMQRLEEAIRAHHEDVSDDETAGELTAWVVAFEVTRLGSDPAAPVEYLSDYAAGPGSPHQSASLAAWASANILEAVEMHDE